MPKFLPADLTKYDHFCEQLQKRRDILDKSQSELAREAGYRNANFISMIESRGATIPVERVPGLSKGYNLKYHAFMKALIMTRYPDMWKGFMSILQNEPDIVQKSQSAIENEVDAFIEKIGKLSSTYTG